MSTVTHRSKGPSERRQLSGQSRYIGSRITFLMGRKSATQNEAGKQRIQGKIDEYKRQRQEIKQRQIGLMSPAQKAWIAQVKARAGNGVSAAQAARAAAGGGRRAASAPIAPAGKGKRARKASRKQLEAIEADIL